MSKALSIAGVGPACQSRHDVGIAEEFTESWTTFNLSSFAWLYQQGDVAACIPALLVALGWPGTARQLAEALPDGTDTLDLTDLRNTLSRLGYNSTVRHGRLSRLDRIFLPAMFVPDQQAAFVILEAERGTCTVFRPGDGRLEAVSRPVVEGTLISFAPLSPDEDAPTTGAAGGSPNAAADKDWFARRLAPLRKFMVLAFAQTLFANVLALANPLFVMMVYDRVIATGSANTLYVLAAGATTALFTEILIRRLRAATTTYCGARLSYVVGNAIFRHLLELPSALTDRASIGAQVARLKDLERVRDLLTGPLALACLDLPFTLIYIATMIAIGGWLAVTPLVAVAIYGLFAILVAPRVRRLVTEAARANARREELLLEAIEKMRALRVTGADEIWIDRYCDQSKRTAMANYRNARFSAMVLVLSQSLSMLAGVATMAFGIHLILADQLTTGGLIASMILVWRVLAPLQGAFMTTTRLDQIRSSIRQIDGLMAMPSERPEGRLPLAVRGIAGQVSFNRVTFRYGRDGNPVLSNVTFEAQPGEVVAILGRNGSGKSSILKLIAGLYQPQMGSVRIENRDLRQFDPIELRHRIAYVPQVPQLFHGTVAENLRMVEPMAPDQELWEAIARAGALAAVRDLPRGLDTLIDSRSEGHLASSLLARLSLARAFLKKAPILLLDEPVSGLDFDTESIFLAALAELRGKSTVFMVTHRPGHLRLADKALLLDDGGVRYYGAAAKVVDKIPPELM